RRACFLIERTDFLGNVTAIEKPEILDWREGKPARQSRNRFGVAQIDERLEQAFDLEVYITLGAGGHLVAGRSCKLLGRQQHHAWFERVLTGNKLSDGRADPAQNPVRSEGEIPVRCGREAFRPQLELGGQRFLRRGPDGAGILTFRAAVGGEAETLHLADMMAFY